MLECISLLTLTRQKEEFHSLPLHVNVQYNLAFICTNVSHMCSEKGSAEQIRFKIELLNKCNEIVFQCQESYYHKLPFSPSKSIGIHLPA